MVKIREKGVTGAAGGGGEDGQEARAGAIVGASGQGQVRVEIAAAEFGAEVAGGGQRVGEGVGGLDEVINVGVVAVQLGGEAAGGDGKGESGAGLLEGLRRGG